MESLSRVWLSTTPWTVAYQAPPSMGFSRQEYWSGLPFPSPGDLPNPGIEPRSASLQADILPSEPPGNPRKSKREIITESLRFVFFRGKIMWISFKTRNLPYFFKFLTPNPVLMHSNCFIHLKWMSTWVTKILANLDNKEHMAIIQVDSIVWSFKIRL